MSELHQDLRLLRNESDAATRKEWNRSVPFPEALFDRWERARVLGFGEPVDGADRECAVCLLRKILVGREVRVAKYHKPASPVGRQAGIGVGR